MRLFFMLPLLGFAVLAYVIISMMQPDMASWLGQTVYTVSELPSGGDIGLILTNGDLFVLISLFLLGIEVMKSSNTGGFSLANHGFSLVVFIVAMVMFLLVEGYATGTFLMIVVMTLVDVVGMVITIVTARRDIDLAGFGG